MGVELRCEISRERLEADSLGIDKVVLALGAFFLAAGALVYLVDRPIGSIYFLADYRGIHSYFAELAPLYGKLGMSAPAFFHPLAFSLLTAGFLCTLRAKIVGCIAWFLANVFFELGQTMDAERYGYLLDHVAIVPGVKRFFSALVHGTYDPFDLLAVVLGSSAGLLIILYRYKKESNYEKRDSTTCSSRGN